MFPAQSIWTVHHRRHVIYAINGLALEEEACRAEDARAAAPTPSTLETRAGAGGGGGEGAEDARAAVPNH